MSGGSWRGSTRFTKSQIKSTFFCFDWQLSHSKPYPCGLTQCRLDETLIVPMGKLPIISHKKSQAVPHIIFSTLCPCLLYLFSVFTPIYSYLDRNIFYLLSLYLLPRLLTPGNFHCTSNFKVWFLLDAGRVWLTFLTSGLRAHGICVMLFTVTLSLLLFFQSERATVSSV